MLCLTCTMISSVDLAHYGVIVLKIGYLWIVVQVKDNYPYFTLKTHLVTCPENRFYETILIRDHNIFWLRNKKTCLLIILVIPSYM